MQVIASTWKTSWLKLICLESTTSISNTMCNKFKLHNFPNSSNVLRSFFRPTTRSYVGLPSSLSPPSSHRASVLLRSYLLMRSHLATSRPVRYTSSVAIRSTMYDTHLRATHTTTSSIRGVQIPIYLVSDATDSLQRSVAVLKLYQ